MHSIRRVRMRIHIAKVREVKTDPASLRGLMPRASVIRHVNTRRRRRVLMFWPWRDQGLCLFRVGCTVHLHLIVRFTDIEHIIQTNRQTDTQKDAVSTGQ